MLLNLSFNFEVLMEPLSSAAIAVATIILTKALEKTGEGLGEVFTNQVGQLAKLVRDKNLPKTVAIEKANQPVDYGEAVLELEVAEKTDPELARMIGALAETVQTNPNLLKKVQELTNLVKREPSIIHNHSKLAEKIGMVVQGGTVNLDTMNV
jgi:hypothetical protein